MRFSKISIMILYALCQQSDIFLCNWPPSLCMYKPNHVTHLSTGSTLHFLPSTLSRIWLRSPRPAHSKDRTWLTFFPRSEVYVANSLHHSTTFGLNYDGHRRNTALLSHSSTVSELSFSCANSLCLKCPPTVFFQMIQKPARWCDVPRTQWFLSVFTSYSMCR